MDTTSLRFYGDSFTVIIGQNPEMADIANPHGHLYGWASFVIAEDSRGERRRYRVRTFEDWQLNDKAVAQANQQAQALGARFRSGKLPVGFELIARWEPFYPVYGSVAYREEEENDMT